MRWIEEVPKEHMTWLTYRLDELASASGYRPEEILDEVPYGLLAAASAILHEYEDEEIMGELKNVVHWTIQAKRTNKPMKLLQKVDNSVSQKWRYLAAIGAYRVAMRIASISPEGEEIIKALIANNRYDDAESILCSAINAADKDYDDDPDQEP